MNCLTQLIAIRLISASGEANSMMNRGSIKFRVSFIIEDWHSLSTWSSQRSQNVNKAA